ncbi:hypothetical protein [Shinella zoogloeoides]|uniref:hypothetical protein n=1 Tax=Shinella zoogloeoides TaxID=352475 RepID=UPI0028A95BD6|nr:hypothetical protein [Shinella zoogloeoides]
MNLTKVQRGVLAKIKESPWRLHETDREAAALAGAGLIIAAEWWSDGSALYRITPAGRNALDKERG